MDLLGKPRGGAVAWRKLRDIAEGNIQRALSGNSWQDRQVTLEPSQVNMALSDAYRSFNVCSSTDTHFMKSQLGMANFLSQDFECLSYQALVEESRDTLQSYMIATTSKNYETKQGSLSLGGLLTTGQHVIEAGANYRNFHSICFDFDDSELGKLLNQHNEMLVSATGRRWLTRHRNVPELAVNLLLDKQRMINGFVNVANQVEYVQALKQEQPLDPRSYDTAIATGKAILNTLAITIGLETLMDCRHRPACMQLFAPALQRTSDTRDQEN